MPRSVIVAKCVVGVSVGSIVPKSDTIEPACGEGEGSKFAFPPKDWLMIMLDRLLLVDEVDAFIEPVPEMVCELIVDERLEILGIFVGVSLISLDCLGCPETGG